MAKETRSFKQAFKDAYNKGKGKGSTFTWNGNTYTALTAEDLKGNKWNPNNSDFRKNFSEYLQSDEDRNSETGHLYGVDPAYVTDGYKADGYKARAHNWFMNNSAAANMPDEKVDLGNGEFAYREKVEPVTTPISTPKPQRLDMFTNDDIRNLGFNNYAGLVNAVKTNANNNFVKALTNRYGTDTSKWDQNQIESELGVHGKYRSFGSGDFGDMSRSMATWLGDHNGRIDAHASNASNYNIFAFHPELLKYQQGGQINMNEQQLQQQIVQLVQAAMQGDQQASQQIQQIMQAAQQGNQQAAQIAQMIQAVTQQMQQSQIQADKKGAKLNYLRELKGQCPEGYELGYLKAGGHICKRCMKKQEGGEVESTNPIDQFRAGGKKRACKGIKFQTGGQTKKLDQAAKDSIAVNKHGDQDIEINRPGNYKKNKQGKVQWTPDRTKAPYKKTK